MSVASNPYGPNPSDFLSNVNKFEVIESTLEKVNNLPMPFSPLKKLKLLKL